MKTPTNLEKGKEYEQFINTYINILPTTQNSYLWQDVPEQVLYNAGLITDYNEHRLKRKNKNVDPDAEENENTLKDVGIDIIQVKNEDEIVFVQCKNYKNAIRVEDLAGFWMIMMKHIGKNGAVYHSVNRISINIKENMCDRVQFIHKPFFR